MKYTMKKDLKKDRITLLLLSSGNCGMPWDLQGVYIPIINDAECSSRHGSWFQSSSMICVWGGTLGGIGACYVRNSIKRRDIDSNFFFNCNLIGYQLKLN